VHQLERGEASPLIWLAAFGGLSWLLTLFGLIIDQGCDLFSRQRRHQP
jgi:hypothetical protein